MSQSGGERWEMSQIGCCLLPRVLLLPILHRAGAHPPPRTRCAPPHPPPISYAPASRPLLARFSLLMPAPQRQAAASPPSHPPSSSSSMRSSSSSSYAACFGSVPRRPPARFVPQRVAIPHRMDAQSTHSFVTSCSLPCRQAAACRTPSINGTSMSAAPGADPQVPPLLCRAEPALRIRMPLHR